MTSKRRKWKNSQLLSIVSACLPSLRILRKKKSPFKRQQLLTAKTKSYVMNGLASFVLSPLSALHLHLHQLRKWKKCLKRNT